MSSQVATAPAATTLRTADRHSGLPPGRLSGWEAPAGASAVPATGGRKERFAAYVAHELRAPVTLQRTLVEVALSDPDANTAALREMGERVLACCLQQQRLIDALLDLTRSRFGPTRHAPVDLAAITGEALRAHDLSELESVIGIEPARAPGDQALLERLAANLVSNAIRHNLPGGRIEIATRTEAGHAVLSVANTGPLVPTSDLPRLFQPFHRLDSTPRTSSDGVGLGLAIVHAIARAHNATLAAEALSGGGLKIDVRFPAVPSGP
jgi:signal transduction histidine kinase